VSIAVEAAKRAATFIRDAERPTEPTAWTQKGLKDFVTEVDRGAEQIIAEYLLATVPGSAVLGEELSPTATKADLLWVVDPLDGTTNYLHGYPAYAVSIGAVVDGTLRAGAVLDIVRDLTFTAASEAGAWCAEARLSVSQVQDPAVALVGTGFPFKVPELLPRYLRQFADIMGATSGVRRAGSAALDLVDVALGRFDGFWELYLAPWDVAAGTLLVREAGGIVTDIDGDIDVVRHGSIVAGNPAMHRWLLGLLES
jgi:myo-inositol-1(or 4)-monophosphatase